MRVRTTYFAALTLVLAGVLAGCGSDSSGSSGSDSSAPAPQAITVTVVGDTITPTPGKVPVKLNTELTINVTSDVAEEVHIHGYDKKIELEPGVEGTVTFKADIPGDFEVELEESATLLFELEVK